MKAGEDPLLTLVERAREQMLAAERDLRLLLAYAREFAEPRPYRLEDLARAAGMSISGIRTAYDDDEIAEVAAITGLRARARGAHRQRGPASGTGPPPCTRRAQRPRARRGRSTWLTPRTWLATGHARPADVRWLTASYAEARRVRTDGPGHHRVQPPGVQDDRVLLARPAVPAAIRT